MTIPDHAKASFNKMPHATDRCNLALVEYPDTPTPANPAACCLLAVTTGRISRLCCSFGLYQTEVVSPAEVWQSLFGGSSFLVLTGNMTLWKARHFIPASVEGQAVLSHLIERHRVIDVAGRS